ncbi:hypothetical protein B4Q04_04925 [Zobellia sp. OII3]|nr:hypothetical protein B4Q04_04925 [Zobellia sp. OII3]
MNTIPKRTFVFVFFFLGVTFLLNLACSKDVDHLKDAVFSKPIIPIDDDSVIDSEESEIEENLGEGQQEDQLTEEETEIRMVVFHPINDAYLQNGIGYNEPLMRLEENRRTSYLMFDLSPIDSIKGKITAANLVFVVNSDDGNGEIDVYKGSSNDWTETDLTKESAPEIEHILGVVEQEFRVNSEVRIDLNESYLSAGYTSLVLDHKDGDDLAFASKESAIGGSKLIVSYEVPVGTKILELENLGANEENEWDSNDEPGKDTAEGQDQDPEGNDTEQEGEEEPVDDPVEEEAPVGEEPIETPIEEETPVEEEEPIDDPVEEETPAEEEPVEENPEVPEPPTSPANEAPVAVVGATPKEGSLPLKVSFNGGDSSDDKAVVSYLWDFKDGETASSKNPEHTFTEAGTYDVVLKVKDEEGLSSSGKLTIKVLAAKNEAPTAKISANTKSGEAPLEVRFTGSGSSDDQGIKTYAWNFKDGKAASTANPVHTFAKAGTFVVELAVSDEEGLTDKETVTITVEEPKNDPPVSKPSASSQSGEAPVEIHFTGSNSTDDNEITGYKWDFGDGAISTEANPKHTFDTPGTYSVKLEVVDKGGLKDVEHISITVSAPENEAPTAVASASVLSGEAPLKVDFTGGNSSDDKGVVGYSWDFSDGTSSSTNPSHTFNNPGTYMVKLTVRDEEGLVNTDNLTIAVAQMPIGNIDCSVRGGFANDSGEKIWCWSNIDIPSYSGSKGAAFSNGELHIDSECYERQVTKSGNRIKFKVDPTVPDTEDWCSRDFNLRAEIRTGPWDVRHESGTEEWFGWSYTFGDNYIIDENSQWKFFQVHNGIVGKAPQIGLEIIHGGQFIGHEAGEIYVTNAAGGEKFNPTGIVPRAGQTIDVVVHAIWGNSSNGLLQVWIDGKKVYDRQVSTMLSGYPWGGNAKWGIYKWPWANSENVEASKNQGIGYLETYMSDLRIITRKPGDLNYGADSYSRVAPN